MAKRTVIRGKAAKILEKQLQQRRPLSPEQHRRWKGSIDLYRKLRPKEDH